MKKIEKRWLEDKYKSLKQLQQESGDCAENYTNGYRTGHRNGQIELIEKLLNIDTGERTTKDT